VRVVCECDWVRVRGYVVCVCVIESQFVVSGS
jgi:hypothetical protein